MREIGRAFASTGVATVASIISGVITAKLLALMLGPSGVGLFSLFRQVHQAGLTLATMNGQSAIVQGISSRNGMQRESYIRSTFWALTASGCAVSMTVAILAPTISTLVLGTSDPEPIAGIRWLSVAILVSVLLFFFTSLLNGLGAIGRLAIVSALTSITSVLLAYPAAALFREGQLAAPSWQLTLAGLVATAAAISFLARDSSFALRHLRSTRINAQDTWSSIYMSGALLATGLLSSATQLGLRSLIIHEFGLREAGFMDVAWMLGMAYTTLGLVSLSSYYLPALSKTDSQKARQAVILNMLRFVAALALPALVLMISIKPLVVEILYSAEFYGALPITQWMLAGAAFKVAAWVLTMPMLASSDARSFVVSEVIWYFVFSTIAAITILGFHWLPGVGVGFGMAYLCNLLYSLQYTGRHIRLHVDFSLIAWLAVGFAIIAITSIITWDKTEVSWLHVWITLTAAVFVSTRVVGSKRLERALRHGVIW